MTEPNAASWRTPKGYRVEEDKKLFHLPSGHDIENPATECEMELWQICEAQREKLRGLVKAARTFVRHADVMDDQAGEELREAIDEAEKE